MRVLIIPHEVAVKPDVYGHVELTIYSYAEIIKSKKFDAVFIESGIKGVLLGNTEAYVAHKYVSKVKTILKDLIGEEMPETFKGQIIGDLCKTLRHPINAAGKGFEISHPIEKIIVRFKGETEVQIMSYKMKINPFYGLLQKMQKRACRFVEKIGQKLESKKYVYIK